jgi:hypothetical protein
MAIYDALAQVDGKDHGAAVAAYASVSVVSLLLNTAARAMFGVFVLIFPVVASRSGVISRPLLYAGIVFGIALIAAHVTGLSALSLALNIAMGVFLTVWPVWLGIKLLRSRPANLRAQWSRAASVEPSLLALVACPREACRTGGGQKVLFLREQLGDSRTQPRGVVRCRFVFGEG